MTDLYRIEICLAMTEGRKPRLLTDIQSWDSHMPESSIHVASEFTSLDPRSLTTDQRLLSIWVDLQHYSKLANESGTPIPPELFLSISTTLPNRLLRLSYKTQSTSELVRLCMLVYIKSILFSLPGLGKRMFYLSTNLEMALQEFVPLDRENSIFLLWALFVVGGCIFEDFTQAWHRQAILETCRALGVKSWIQCRGMLNRVLWIGDVHDPLAQDGFTKVFGAA
jgi:hypothetical protein